MQIQQFFVVVQFRPDFLNNSVRFPADSREKGPTK